MNSFLKGKGILLQCPMESLRNIYNSPPKTLDNDKVADKIVILRKFVRKYKFINQIESSIIKPH